MSTAQGTAGGSTARAFKYVAISTAGDRAEQVMLAPSAEAVAEALRNQGWIPLKVTEHRQSAGDKDITAWITGGGVKLKWGQRAEFARKLNQMLRAGISPAKSLASMADGASPAVSKMCMDMSEKVMSGRTLSEAMREHPRAFDEVTVAYIETGEQSGALVETTERLAKMLADRAALQSKIKGVSAYPKMVGGSIAVLVTGIILFLVRSEEHTSELQSH